MRKWMPLAAVCLGTFMLLVDVTIVNVALPDMAVDLHTSFSSLQWVIDSYAVALAALLMGLGSVADLRGRRRVYLAGLTVFAAASLASGLATSPGLLIAARAVQGVGGAAMFATTIALLNASYQGRDRGTAFGVWGAVAGGSAAVGPVLGGLITETLSWRWIFFVNLPVSVAAMLLTLAAFGAGRRQPLAGFDLAGVLAFTAGAAATTIGLVRASSVGWAAGQTLGLIAAGLAAFVALRRDRAPGPAAPAAGVAAAPAGLRGDDDRRVAAQRRGVRLPGLHLAVAADRARPEPGRGGAGRRGAAVAVRLRGERGHRPLPARLEPPVDHRRRDGAGRGGCPAPGRPGPQSGWTHLVPGLIVAGIGVGLATPTLVSSAMSAVPVHSGGMAAGAVNTMRQLGYAFGIALLGSVFSARVAHQVAARGGHPEAARAVSGGQAQRLLASTPAGDRAGLDQVVHAAAAAGLNGAFLLAGVLGLAGAVIAVAGLRRPAPPRAADPAPAQPAQAQPARAGPAPAGPAYAGPT